MIIQHWLVLRRQSSSNSNEGKSSLKHIFHIFMQHGAPANAFEEQTQEHVI